ncbi:MAG TPA: DNA circularization N-terminal domain-containing protein [Polyangiaceae bacterium]|nr:DNA circularization N-terminal domain-containing protein [Polyangiaceae bacterium]
MPAFDSLQQAQFGQIKFPIESCRMKSTLRKHDHEYPPAPGAATEKMGRTPYIIEMMGNFQTTFKRYPDLWPKGVFELRKLYEQVKTEKLVIPTVGTIDAFQIEWDQSMEAKIRSGEKCMLRFQEDFSENFLVGQMVSVTQNNIAECTAILSRLSFAVVGHEESIFTQIQNAANGILALKDQQELAMSLYESKIMALTALIEEADRSSAALQDPDNFALLDALQALWAATLDLGDNLKNAVTSPSTYTTPTQMTPFDVSAAVYDGDGSRGGDILSLNNFEDPFKIPAGTGVRYYPSLAA